MPDSLYFEDFTVGRAFTTHGWTLTEADIISFAQQYDPQPFHIDREAAAQLPYGGIIASGIHTLAVAIRLVVQANVFTTCSLGSPGLDQVRWYQPVRPGDTLTTRAEVVDAAPSESKPDRGHVRIAYTVWNQDGDTVMAFRAWQILRARYKAGGQRATGAEPRRPA